MLRRDLLAWWTLHGRHGIPWKLRSDGSAPRDGEPLCPFRIWVAEVMLQQTQLAVMRPYWERWMLAFPDVVALAEASQHQVLLQWQGLGYYSRARRLHRSAGLLAAHGWPRDLEGWQALPGIGRSTAGSRNRCVDGIGWWLHRSCSGLIATPPVKGFRFNEWSSR